MKKGVCILLAMALLLSAGSFCFSSSAAEEPVISIASKEQLSSIRNNLTGQYRLVADIVFTEADFAEGGAFYNGGKGWSPIGTSANKPFDGTLMGNGHSISGLMINVTATETESCYLGLFNYLGKSASVRDLNMENTKIVVSGAKNVRAGAIAAQSQGVVMNCTVEASITALDNINIVSVGGIVGRQTDTGIVSSCRADVAVEASSVTTRVGSLVGENAGGSVYSSNGTGSVKGYARDKIYIGGLIGYANQVTKGTAVVKGELKNCSFVGTVEGDSSNETYGGAICGFNESAVTNIFSDATAYYDCDSRLYAGVFFGTTSGVVKNVYSIRYDPDTPLVGNGSAPTCHVLTKPFSSEQVADLLAVNEWQWVSSRPQVKLNFVSAPTGMISAGSHKKSTFTAPLSFDTFIPASSVSVDTSAQSVEYLLSDSELSLADLDASADWNRYSRPVSLASDGKEALYVRLTSSAGYVTYLNAGYTVDTLQPVINGLQDGCVYCEDTFFQVTDEHLSEVRVNDTTVLNYLLIAQNEPYTVTAVDKAGNASTVTVTVNDGHRAAPTADPSAKIVCRYCNATLRDEIPLFDVSVNSAGGGSATCDQTKVAYGGNVTFTATPDEGYTFAGWFVNGRSASANPLTVAVHGDTVVTPVFRAVEPTSYTVTFLTADGGYVATMSDLDVMAGTDLPDVPKRFGYTANGWDFSPDDPISADLTVYPNYVKDPATYTVSVVGGTATKNDVPFETRVTVTASDPSSFVAWTEGGVVVSTSPSYTFFITHSRQLSVITNGAAPSGGIVVDCIAAVSTGDTTCRTTVICEVFADPSVEVVERGILYTVHTALDSDDLIIGTSGVSKRTSSTVGAGQFMYSLTGTPKQCPIAFRGYMVVKDGSGALQTVYSPIETRTFS